MSDTEADLADAATDLAETLEALRAELHESRRGPFGLPRPPTPGELLTATERYTIPAPIAVFEANIRMLELLAAAIRLVQGRPLAPDAEARLESSEFAIASGREGVDRLAAVSRTTLEKLDDALADLQEAAEGGTPENPEAERLLREARELRAEIDDRLAETMAAERTEIGVREESEPDPEAVETDDDADRIDVDAELQSLKDDVDSGEDDEETPNDK